MHSEMMKGSTWRTNLPLGSRPARVAQALTIDLRDEIADWSAWRVEVVDARGRTVIILPFAEVLEPVSVHAH
jgi:hypothetical protein